MEKTKANFRAIRDLLGMSQQDIADEFGVNVKSVKRWESPGNGWLPPDEVWEFLLDCLDVQGDTVDMAMSAAIANQAGAVQITYFKSQNQYDEYGRDDGPYGMANANARIVAHRLMALGYEVAFSFPDDEGNLYHSR